MRGTIRGIVASCLFLAAARADQSAPPPSVSVADGLLARWLDAQNRGDFAAYQALYARDFTGVRRSGEKVVELDRAAWMRDRARMFKKPMRVAADDVRSSPSMIELTQTWSSGTYRDRGPKRLTLVNEEGALRIAREEMLASRPLRPDLPTRCDAGPSLRSAPRPHTGETVELLDLRGHQALAVCRGARLVAAGWAPGEGETLDNIVGEAFELRPGEYLIAVERSTELCKGDPDGEGDPDCAGSDRYLTWYRVAGGELQDVYGHSTHEFMDYEGKETRTEIELAQGRRARSGYYDLVVRSSERDRDGDERRKREVRHFDERAGYY